MALRRRVVQSTDGSYSVSMMMMVMMMMMMRAALWLLLQNQHYEPLSTSADKAAVAC